MLEGPSYLNKVTDWSSIIYAGGLHWLLSWRGQCALWLLATGRHRWEQSAYRRMCR